MCWRLELSLSEGDSECGCLFLQLNERNSPTAFVCVFVCLYFSVFFLCGSIRPYFSRNVFYHSEKCFASSLTRLLPHYPLRPSSFWTEKMYHAFSCKPPISCQVEPRPHEGLSQHTPVCPSGKAIVLRSHENSTSPHSLSTIFVFQLRDDGLHFEFKTPLTNIIFLLIFLWAIIYQVSIE